MRSPVQPHLTPVVTWFVLSVGVIDLLLDWIYVANDRKRWMAFVYRIITLGFHKMLGKFLSWCATGRFSRMAHLHSAPSAALHQLLHCTVPDACSVWSAVGCAVALAVSRMLHIAWTWVPSHARSYGIYTASDYPRELGFPLPILIPPTTAHSLIILSSTLHSLGNGSGSK
jgi:hypothetical protein